MSQICYNAVCNHDQNTDGCPAAERCPYYIGEWRVTTTSNGTRMVIERLATSNTVEEKRTNTMC